MTFVHLIGQRRGLDRETLIFIVKWATSVVQILGYAATGLGLAPLNIYLFLVGMVGWFAVGVFWQDKAIMLIHVIAFGVLAAGLFGAS